MDLRVGGSRARASILGAPSLSLLAAIALIVPAAAQGVRGDFYATNGWVRTTALSGSVLYVGGEFTEVAYATGGAAAIDPATGVRVPGFPKVVGRVEAIASDGAGGWYLAGGFTSVGGVPRANLAHVTASHQVSAWNPGTNGAVEVLVVSGTTVYAGGAFTSVGGQTRVGIAALDAATGLVTAWNPDARMTTSMPNHGIVRTIVVSGATVYVGGHFDQIGGQPRLHIAALDAGTNTNNATAWTPDANADLYALAVSGTTVYAGGAFTTIGGRTRNRIAALDATIESVNATSWNPNVTGTLVSALAVSGNIVYAGGYFTQIGGQLRNSLAALDATIDLNNATPWNPNAGNAVVSDLLVSGSTVYVAGNFTAIGGQPRDRIAALDALLDTNNATSWNPRANASVNALGFDGTRVIAGGELTAINGQTRNRIAAFDVNTGLPTAWNPDANGTVHTLAPSGSTVYVGGSFTQIGGQPRAKIAALDAATGLATAWNPNAGSAAVFALAVSGSTVYAGGTFESIGGQSRSRIAALDAATGLATAWNPNATGVFPGGPLVRALVVSGNTVYAGGRFSGIGGQSRNHIAALDATVNTSNATGWNPDANGEIYALALNEAGTIVYAGGEFTAIGGLADRQHIAALDATVNADNATSWNPSANAVVFSLGVRGQTVYAGGAFTTVGGNARRYLAALDAAGVGAATPWNPGANDGVWAISVNGTSTYVGGNFTSIGGLPQTYLAAMGNGLAEAPDPLPVAGGLRLRPNQPNPFGESTRIRFALAGPDRVTLEVFDLAGRLVAMPLAGAWLEAGDHSVPFRGRDLEPGVYPYRLQVGNRTARGKMVIAR